MICPKAQQNEAARAFLKAMEILNADGFKNLFNGAAKIKKEELTQFDKNAPFLKLAYIFQEASERLRAPHRFLAVHPLTAGIIIRQQVLPFTPSMCLSPPQAVVDAVAEKLKAKEIRN